MWSRVGEATDVGKRNAEQIGVGAAAGGVADGVDGMRRHGFDGVVRFGIVIVFFVVRGRQHAGGDYR